MYPFLQIEPLKSLLGRSVFHYLQYLNNYLGQLINLKHTRYLNNYLGQRIRTQYLILSIF